MILRQVEILGLKVAALSMVETVHLIEIYIKKGKKPRQVITLNAEIAYQAQSEPKLRRLINEVDLVTPDGHGIVWASRELGNPVPERVTGIDLMQELLQRAGTSDWRVFFLGARPGAAEQAAENLRQRYPQLQIETHHGYFTSEEEPAVLAKIKRFQPHLLFVGLGAPKQEYWLQENLPKIQVPVGIGVGGSFDVLAGKVKRAPYWVQRLKLEWLARVIKEPSRWRRSLALPRFIFLVRQEIKKKA